MPRSSSSMPWRMTTLQDVLKGGVFLSGPASPVPRQAGDGEHGALSGLHHRPVGGDDPGVQGIGQVDAIHGLLILHHLGKAPEDQGQNDPGVAPGPPEHGRGADGRGLAHGVGGFLPQLSGGGADGQAHIGSRVPVGNGEDVELIDLLFFRVQRSGGVNEHPRQCFSINGLYHNSSSLSSQSICMEST